MTSIVAVYNPKGVAIAADSAGTLSGHGKVFSSNKIFRLSVDSPVGIATYGISAFGGVPRDIILKKFRNDNPTLALNKLEDYHKEIIDFIEKEESINFNDKNIIIPLVANIINELKRTEEEDIDMQIANFLDNIKKINNKYLPSEIVDKLMIAYNGLNIEHIVNKETKEKIKPILERCLTDKIFNGEVGLIFAGYGEEEIFPRVFHMELYIKYDGVVYYDVKANYNTDKASGILPFAQSDAIETVLTGISNGLNNYLGLNLTKGNIIDTIKRETQNNINGFVGITRHLSLDELATMSETFVNLESFKKRMSFTNETVGGPIDVVIISKYDGFIRIKRKHYFDKDMNPHFINKYQ